MLLSHTTIDWGELGYLYKLQLHQPWLGTVSSILGNLYHLLSHKPVHNLFVINMHHIRNLAKWSSGLGISLLVSQFCAEVGIPRYRIAPSRSTEAPDPDVQVFVNLIPVKNQVLHFFKSNET
jgi:hypothetical protein